jgi:hypothetical protein
VRSDWDARIALVWASAGDLSDDNVVATLDGFDDEMRNAERPHDRSRGAFQSEAKLVVVTFVVIVVVTVVLVVGCVYEV